MPQIYETVNKYNKEHNIMPFKYIGSDQNDNPNYFGSSVDLKLDIGELGTVHFEKRILASFDEIDNKSLRHEEAIYLQKYNVKQSVEFYNKTDIYAPGGGVKGMKHKKKKVVSQTWIDSRTGWNPSDETRALWSKQRTGKKTKDSTKEIWKKNKRGVGKNNGNALLWEVTTPDNVVYNIVSLKNWCHEMGYNYYRIYNERDGFKIKKFSKGKGGRKNVQ